MSITHFYIPHVYFEYLVHGKDGRDFFHRMTTQNIKSLQKCEIKKFCLLNPLAHIQTWGWITILEGRIKILSPDPNLDTQFDQYIFSEDLTWEKQSVDCVLKISKTDMAYKSEYKNDQWVINEKDYQLIFAPTLSSQDCTPLAAHQFHNYELYLNIIHPSELTLGVSPLEVSYQDSIHPQKGCYPGQEIIEKITSRGIAPPRMLVVLEGQRDIGAEVFRREDDGRIGVVIASFTDPTLNTDKCLAVIRKAEAVLENVFNTTAGETKIIELR